MNVLLAGSVSSSLAALEGLLRGGVEITGVLGLDDSLASRIADYRSLQGPAEVAGLPFHSFEKISEPAVEEFVHAHRPDLLWAIGLSQIVPNRLIQIARHGAVGFHPTMLPKGRGRAPVAWTILLGQSAAANLFFLTEEPDAGDIIIQREVPVRPDDYAEDLIARTNQVLVQAIIELSPFIKSGQLPRTPQNHSKATHYPKRTAADGRIDWGQGTDTIYRLIRAAGRPYPGAFTTLDGRRMTVWRARPATKEQIAKAAMACDPGSVIRVDPTMGLLMRTGDGGLWLTETEMATSGHR